MEAEPASQVSSQVKTQARALAIIPLGAEMEGYKQIARWGVQSGLLPKTIDTPEKAMIVAIKGRELGIPPMQAYSHIHIIDGKPTMSGELMLSLIKSRTKALIKIRHVHAEDGKFLGVTIRVNTGEPNDTEWSEYAFTMDEARHAGLLEKGTWKKYPKDMCQWRAVSRMARAEFPHIIAGASYTPEELGAEVNEDGEVIIDVQPSSPPSSPPPQNTTSAPRDVSPPPAQQKKTAGPPKSNVVNMPPKDVTPPPAEKKLENHADKVVARPSVQEIQAFAKMREERGWSADEVLTLMQSMFSVDHPGKLTMSDFLNLKNIVQTMSPAEAAMFAAPHEPGDQTQGGDNVQ